jgi:hypothetical protein
MASIHKALFRLTILLVFGVFGVFLSRWQPLVQRGNTDFESHITETLVVACKDTDDMSWLDGHFPVKNTTSSHSTKGRESLAYLNYIVENYDRLADVTIFIHNQDHTWHNVRLFYFRMSRMLAQLDRAFVMRQGYFNLRCDWEPGCPARLNLSSTTYSDEGGQIDREVEAMRVSWVQLHPGEPLPTELAQPCCSQFAASRERIHAVPLERWVHFRDWVLSTPLNDWFAGRVWEYTWQYVLAGDRVTKWCPTERDCFCYGYNVCFDGALGWEAWKRLENATELLRSEYMAVISRGEEDANLKERLLAGESETEVMLAAAIKRGKQEREWHKVEDFHF